MGNRKSVIYDKFPKHIKNATSTSDGLMSAEDKARIDGLFEFGMLSNATPEKDGLMSKEDKTKLDGIEEDANNYVHPDTPEIRHVSDNEKSKWNNQTKYTNTQPTPIALGGIEKGSTFDNMDFNTLFSKLLYPYIDPTISNIVITPSNTIVEKDQSFKMTRIKFNINAPSLQNSDSIHYDFKMNNSTFHSIDTPNRAIDVNVDVNITDNTSITVTAIDNINEKQKNFSLINYKFVYPFYYGTLSIDEVINETTVLSKTKMVQDKGNKTIKFTTNNQKIMFAYPKEYGKLKTIYDANNFNIISTFSISEININNIPYYVYYNDLSSVTDYNIQFIF